MIYKKVLENPDDYDFNVKSLGECVVDSPVNQARFVLDEDRVIFPSSIQEVIKIQSENKEIPSFEKAGPRQKIFHAPFSTRAAIVTCGGLCPGLNSVIKGIGL